MSLHPFSKLTPDFILTAIESLDFWSDARIYPLNSYENRVYQIGLEDKQPIIAKFYRPNRWTREQIQEEHTILRQLKQQELPVIAPISINNTTLFSHDEFYFCLYEKQLGRVPEADNMDHLFSTGQLLGKMHASMSSTSYQARPCMKPLEDFEDAVRSILSSKFMPQKLTDSFSDLFTKLRTLIFASTKNSWPQTIHPIHGDCHRSNLIVDQEKVYILDFDDSRTGPAIQDVWLHLSGTVTQQKQQLSELIEGYEEYHDFAHPQLALIDSLKVCRLVQYAAWLDKRWEDPAFPVTFPWFQEETYWLGLRKDLQTLHQEWGALL